jgi:hypothetical protein
MPHRPGSGSGRYPHGPAMTPEQRADLDEATRNGLRMAGGCIIWPHHLHTQIHSAAARLIEDANREATARVRVAVEAQVEAALRSSEGQSPRQALNHVITAIRDAMAHAATSEEGSQA